MIGRVVPLFNGLVPICVTEKQVQLMIEINSHLIRSRFITCINSFTVHRVIGRVVPLFNGLVPICVTEKQVQLMIEINSHLIRSRFITCI